MSNHNAELSSSASRRAGLAGFLGTLIEYFEFISYGHLAVVISPQFFPSDNRATSILSGLLVFASGYLVRPLGGIFFGWLGDRHGRKTALVATVVIMGTASVAIGVLPTYAAIGLFAPILLVAARLVQGFSAGGEIIGSATYVTESAPQGKKGFYSALTPLGSTAGVGLAGIVAGIIALSVTSSEMSDWGWRIPFLLCLPLTLVTLWVRMGLEDSPEFRRMVEKFEIVKTPALAAVRAYPKNIARVALFAMVVNIVGSVGTTYMTVYLIGTLEMPPAHTYLLLGSVLVFNGLGMLLAGRLMDRIGPVPVLAIGLVCSLAIAIPLFMLINTTTSLLALAPMMALWQLATGTQNPPMLGMATALFPPHIRYSGAALAFNIGVIFGAGLTPSATHFVVSVSGNSFAPAYLVMVASLAGLVVLALSRRSIDRAIGRTAVAAGAGAGLDEESTVKVTG
ncbi:MFS transporter [Rhodococcus sp. B50]|uniref:MFS transporter n=1 Tax=Rhodococcus sp. B50 TaxID=2682847 RepID=UPI001BD5A1D9|nr:MFS transporter [Rhodococcus sp. B50]MBS9376448.1 Proline/betaine transporter [Rhodococcus sp. B50]